MKHIKLFEDVNYPYQINLDIIKDLLLDISDEGFEVNVYAHPSYYDDSLVLFDIIINSRDNFNLDGISMDNASDLNKLDFSIDNLNKLIKEFCQRVLDIGMVISKCNYTLDNKLDVSLVVTCRWW